MGLRTTIVHRPLLTEAEREEMLALHRRVYANVSRARFFRDLDRKDGAIVLHGGDGAIAGFSTIHLLRLRTGRGETLFLFSGDTVVAREQRRTPALAGAFGHVMLHVLDRFPALPCYWFLVAKGLRTYRFLPLYFRRFHPTRREPTPAGIERLRRAIGRDLFGEAYDAEAGIVRHAGVADRLRAREVALAAPRGRLPDARFFLAGNPGHAQGEELACLAEVSRANLTPAALRVIERTPTAWRPEGESCFAP